MQNIWTFLGFIICIIVFIVFGEVAGFRVIGLLCIIQAVYALKTQSVPVGIEGRPASFYITGFPAIIYGILLGLVGTFFVLFPMVVSNALT